MTLCCVSKKVMPLVGCNFDIHKLILMIFGRKVTEKASFGITWQNRKPENHIFSLRCYVLLCQQTFYIILL